MFNLVIFGGPGSGKGTQSEKLIGRYGLTHISTGQVLRDEIAAGTKLGAIADSFISKGNLIPDKLMVEILADKIDKLAGESRGFIFDGFPRTIAQAEELSKLLSKHGAAVDAVIGLEVPDDELTSRLISRGQASGRSDDNEETIRHRLDIYHKTTSPLKDFYITDGSYVPVHGIGTVDEIFKSITDVIDACLPPTTKA